MNTFFSKFPRTISFRSAILIGLLLLTLCAALPRYSDLSMPLLDFHPTRQLFGAIKARGYFYQHAKDIPDWQKQIAARQVNVEAVIEPPLLENASAWLYGVYGENTGLPRAISASFWMLAGIFLFLLSKNLSKSQIAGMVSLAFFWLLPYGIHASRAFQPDPLMVFLLILFWWALERWCERRGWGWAVATGLLGGMAIFVKFTAVFFVVFPAIGALLAQKRLPSALKDPQAWLVALLGILPAGAYFYYGTFIDPFLVQQFGGRFFLEKWVDPFFYIRWWMVAENVIPFVVVLAGLLAVAFTSNIKSRTFYIWLFVGYLLFGLTFAHHIASHDYYSLPLIPIFGLLLGEFVSGLLTFSKLETEHIHSGIVTILAVLLLVQTGTGLIDQRAEHVRLDQAAAKWEAIGNAIGHQPGLISLTTDYGYPLEYYGYQNTSLWPSYADIEKLKKEFPKQAANRSFFLVTDFNELANQPGLLPYLTERFRLIGQTPDYILFDLNDPIKTK